MAQCQWSSGDSKVLRGDNKGYSRDLNSNENAVTDQRLYIVTYELVTLIYVVLTQGCFLCFVNLIFYPEPKMTNGLKLLRRRSTHDVTENISTFSRRRNSVKMSNPVD